MQIIFLYQTNKSFIEVALYSYFKLFKIPKVIGINIFNIGQKKQIYAMKQGKQKLSSTLLKGINGNQMVCQQNKPSIGACQNRRCQKYAFVCNDDQCQCQVSHLECPIIFTTRINKLISSKILSLKRFSSIICKKIDESIDSLSDFKQRIQKRIQQQFKYLGLNQKQRLLALAIYKEDSSGIKGKNIWEASLNLEKSAKQQMIQKQIQELEEKYQLKETWDSLNQIISKTQNQINSTLNALKYVSNFIVQNHPLFENSKLIKQISTIKKLSNFFQNQEISSTKLLYRGSQNQFLQSKIYEKCLNIPNTLSIIEKQFGKVIGGFTPLAWQKPNEYYKCIEDQSQSSFIFSLTNNDKFQLSRKKEAICWINNNCPRFGGGNADISIVDRGNQNYCYANICQAYQNDKYTFQDRKSWQKFCGNGEQNKFRLVQMQMWQIKFVQ